MHVAQSGDREGFGAGTCPAKPTEPLGAEFPDAFCLGAEFVAESTWKTAFANERYFPFGEEARPLLLALAVLDILQVICDGGGT